MANKVLVLGESGSGKSSSLRNLDPEKTLVIQAVKKNLPFKKKFKTYSTDDYDKIYGALKKANAVKEIDTIIIDDSQYLMANAFMRRAKEVGFTKFTEIGQNFWNLINFVDSLRDDIDVFFLHHIEENEGKFKAKTIGKMLDSAIAIEGMFTMVIKTEVEDGKYQFRTRNSGKDTCKTPMDMFEDEFIDNDIVVVKNAMKEYWSDVEN